MIVKIHEAKAQLSQLIAHAEAGEEIIVARRNQPVVRLTPIVRANAKRVPGAMKGKWPDLPDSFFFDPLPADELEHFDGDPT